MQPLVESLRKEKINEIVKLSKHNSEKASQINHYKNKIQDYREVLNRNTNFKNCTFYKKIETDIAYYMEKYHR